MSAFSYDSTIERCKALLRQSSAAERSTYLAGFHAVSIQAKTTLECLLHLNPEVDYLIRNGDRLVYATLENITANLDTALHNLIKFFRHHMRGAIVSSHATTFSMQQRLLFMRDELSMNTHDLLSYHTRLRERMDHKHRVPLRPTQRHNIPLREHDTRARQWVQNPAVAPIAREPSRSSRPKTPFPNQSHPYRDDVQDPRAIPLRRASSYAAPMPLRRGTPYPEEYQRGEEFHQQNLPRPKSMQPLHRFNAPSQHEERRSSQDQTHRPSPTEPTRLERPNRDERSRSRGAPANPAANTFRAPSDSGSRKVHGPAAILFVDSFNGTRSILAQACAELLRLWTLNNGAASPFSAIDSAATRLRSSFLSDTSIGDWTLYSAVDARINHAALRALFSQADTHEQSDIGTRISKHRPRGLIASDFEDFDFILTLDSRNFSRLCYLRNLLSTSRARIFLLENVHAPTSPPHDHHLGDESQSQSEYFGNPDFEPLIRTLKVALETFLLAHTSWQRPLHPPFSHRYTPFRSRQFVAPVGIREPTERRIEDLRRRTGCGIGVDRVVLEEEEGMHGRRVIVVSVTGREEVLRDEWDVVRRELGGWI